MCALKWMKAWLNEAWFCYCMAYFCHGFPVGKSSISEHLWQLSKWCLYPVTCRKSPCWCLSEEEICQSCIVHAIWNDMCPKLIHQLCWQTPICEAKNDWCCPGQCCAAATSEKIPNFENTRILQTSVSFNTSLLKLNQTHSRCIHTVHSIFLTIASLRIFWYFFLDKWNKKMLQYCISDFFAVLYFMSFVKTHGQLMDLLAKAQIPLGKVLHQVLQVWITVSADQQD